MSGAAALARDRVWGRAPMPPAVPDHVVMGAMPALNLVPIAVEEPAPIGEQEPKPPAPVKLKLRIKMLRNTPLRSVYEAPAEKPSVWTRELALPLAAWRCNVCLGLGLKDSGKCGVLPCDCVLRAVFRACWTQYQVNRHRQNSGRSSLVVSHFGGQNQGRKSWFFSRPSEEYMADFELLARRTLDEQHYRIFRLHFLEGLDWTKCAPRVGLVRGNFFHAVYRLEQAIGRAAVELQPYALYPTDRYFYGRAGVLPPTNHSGSGIWKG